jgi:hypothetical protein
VQPAFTAAALTSQVEAFVPADSAEVAAAASDPESRLDWLPAP